jgi:hypothetical protein
MKIKIVILAAIMLFGFGCSEKETSTKNIKQIALKENNDVEVLSRFVSDIEYLDLMYPADSLVGPIENLKIINDEIIVKQRHGNTFKYVRFSEDGEFLNEIGHSGSTGNLRVPHDILAFDDKFAIWDEEGVHAYSKTGEYLDKMFRTTHPGNSFFYSQANFYLFHESNGPGYLSEHSNSGEMLKVYKPGNAQIDDLDYSRVIELEHDRFHLFSPINDTIFSYANKQLSPQYLVQGEGYPTLINVLKEIDSLDEAEKLKYLHNNKHWVIKRYLENPNYIFVVYRLASDSFYTLIRKSDWEATHFERVINDIDGGIWDYPMFLSKEDELYIPLGTYQITGHKILNRKRFDFEDVKKRNLQNGNPVIMKCKLK